MTQLTDQEKREHSFFKGEAFKYPLGGCVDNSKVYPETSNGLNFLDIKIAHGLAAALRAMGLNALSDILTEQDRYRESVIASEGVMPIKDRPIETQTRLEFAHKIDLIAYEVFEREIYKQ